MVEYENELFIGSDIIFNEKKFAKFSNCEFRDLTIKGFADVVLFENCHIFRCDICDIADWHIYSGTEFGDCTFTPVNAFIDGCELRNCIIDNITNTYIKSTKIDAYYEYVFYIGIDLVINGCTIHNRDIPLAYGSYGSELMMYDSEADCEYVDADVDFNKID